MSLIDEMSPPALPEPTAVPEPTAKSVRTYEVRTYGCQMNVHDSERLSGLLEDAGYSKAETGTDPDLVVFNTCAVRENADNKLYGNLSQLAPNKEANPRHADRGRRVPGAEGSRHRRQEGAVRRCRLRHSQHRLAARAARSCASQSARRGRNPRRTRGVSVDTASQTRICLCRLGFHLGGLQQHVYVLHRSGLRGKEVDRRPGDILAEVQALVDEGVSEVTLLGQNVNAYGVSFADPEQPRDRGAFASLLKACGHIDGSNG